MYVALAPNNVVTLNIETPQLHILRFDQVDFTSLDMSENYRQAANNVNADQMLPKACLY